MLHLINLSNAEIESDFNLEGYDAYDTSGEKVGDIDAVIADADSMRLRYLVVDAGGWLTQKQYVVPIGELEEVYDNERRVRFRTLTKERLQSGAYPRYDERWLETGDDAGFAAHERELARFYRPDQRVDEGVDYGGDLYQRPQGAQRLQLLEEQLTVNKERYQAGVVRLGKHVTERVETLDVPVREERVVIERRPVEGGARAGEGELREGETIDVPLMRERVDVRKETVVAEEVTAYTEATEHQERVEETVRKEELVVDDPEGLVVDERATTPQQPAYEQERARRG